MRDPYEVLGLARAASDDEIKSAYRRLAKQLHPDVNDNDPEVAERFKEVAAAYAILGDAEQRGRYDRGEIDAGGQEKTHFRYEYAGGRPGGGTGPGAGPGGFRFDFGGAGAEDVIREFFGRGRRAGGAPPTRGEDRKFKITVDFLDAALGTTRRISLPTGKTLDVRIPAGIEEGRSIRLKGQGNPGPIGTPAGDALVEVTIRPHAYFARAGNEVRLTLPVTVYEAVLGARISVPTIHGPVQLSVPKGSTGGRKLRLKGRGIDGEGGKGDQIVTLEIVLPDAPAEGVETLAKRWRDGHPYDVRRKAGLE